MRKLLVLPVLCGLAAALGVAVLGVPMMGAATAGPDPSFTSTPAAGPPGSSITVASITPCPSNPAGVAGPRLVRVSLARGSIVFGSVQLPVTASGGWGGTLAVSRSATPGSASVDAFCFSSNQAEGATLAYTARSFTVVGVAPTSPITPTVASVTG